MKSFNEQVVSWLTYLLQEPGDVGQHKILSDKRLRVIKPGERNEGRVGYAFGTFPST